MEFRVDGLNEVIEKLNNLNRLDEIVEQKVKPELTEFVNDIKSNQLSGRPGLDIITGTLRDSIVEEVVDAGDSLEFIVGSDVDYIIYHQYGTETIPKRLYIEEEWQQFIENDIISIIEDAAREALEA